MLDVTPIKNIIVRQFNAGERDGLRQGIRLLWLVEFLLGRVITDCELEVLEQRVDRDGGEAVSSKLASFTSAGLDAFVRWLTSPRG